MILYCKISVTECGIKMRYCGWILNKANIKYLLRIYFVIVYLLLWNIFIHICFHSLLSLLFSVCNRTVLDKDSPVPIYSYFVTFYLLLSNTLLEIFLLTVINRLRIFMKIHIYDYVINKIELRQKIVLPTKYYKKHYTLDILDIFSYYVHFVQYCTSKFPTDA